MAGCGRTEGEERHGWGADGGCRGRGSAAECREDGVVAATGRETEQNLVQSWADKYYTWENKTLVRFYQFKLGIRLLCANVSITLRLLVKVCRGMSLSRRERQLLTRTTSYIFRDVPGALMIGVPWCSYGQPFKTSRKNSGAAYVYAHYVRPFYQNRQSLNIWYVPSKKDVFNKPDDILTAAEKYIKENGLEAFENIIHRALNCSTFKDIK